MLQCTKGFTKGFFQFQVATYAHSTAIPPFHSSLNLFLSVPTSSSSFSPTTNLPKNFMCSHSASFIHHRHHHLSRPAAHNMWSAVAKTLSASRIRITRVHFHMMPSPNPILGVVSHRRLSSEVPAGWNGKMLPFSQFSNSFNGKDRIFLMGSSRSLGTLAETVASTDEEFEASTPPASQIQDLLEQLVKEDVDDCIKGDRTSKSQPSSQNKSNLPHHQHSRHPKLINGMSPSKYASLKRRQIKMETEAWEQAAEEYRELLSDMCERKLAPNLPYMKSLFMSWFEPLRDKIAKEQKLYMEPSNSKVAHAPYFILLPEDMMAVVTMHKLMGLLMTGDGSGSTRVITAAIHIGSAIEQEVRIQRFMEKTKKNKKKTSDDDEDTNDVSVVTKDEECLRKKVSELMRRQKIKVAGKIVKAYDATKPWGQANHARVGSRLIEMLIEVAYIQPPIDQSGDGFVDIRPAFRHVQRVVTTAGQVNLSRRYGVIECDPLVRQGLDRTARHMVIPYIPMLVPPVNWTGHDKGAHFYLPSHIMRTHGAKRLNDAIKTASKQQMRNVYKALNTLGNTKWRINKRVLNIVDRIWSDGGNLAALVNHEDVPLPEKPNTEDDAEIKKWKWSLNFAKKENSERHSQRCDTELKLSVARKLKDEEGFYYPHNIDFRGRAYPMHPYLNHLGSDLCRGILEFAEGRPLGKSGLRWLKMHLANIYGGGFDKLPLDGRATFAENHVEDIFDSADRPLEGRRWWLGAEDPFQCLAVCINLAVALRSSSPESTISHLPIHQDGSCNGLQHYAALGRDTLGAAAVNMVTNDKPADLYSDIAGRVFQIMKKDSMKDPASYPNASHAKLLIDQVDRKLVKQTVMTSVYGVTHVGAREQIRKRLKERNFNGDVDNNQLFRASCYAAKVTLTALGEIFTAAHDIKTWLGDCAKIIAMENHPVKWTTPIGIPVIQPYMEAGKLLVKTSLQTLSLQRETDKVVTSRQKSAFPPNFVHSLDGAHMMMTAIACGEAGLNFAGVHDSYWTHACDVDVMNRILREEFVELYETPILENLLDGFQKSFPSLDFPPLPNRGDFDLREVLSSTYFFN